MGALIRQLIFLLALSRLLGFCFCFRFWFLEWKPRWRQLVYYLNNIVRVGVLLMNRRWRRLGREMGILESLVRGLVRDAVGRRLAL